MVDWEAVAATHAGTIRHQLAEIEKLRASLKRKDVLIERLHVVAKNVSHALMSFTPGGSEYFTRVKVDDFEDYYADADACQRRVRERIDGAEQRARDLHRVT